MATQRLRRVPYTVGISQALILGVVDLLMTDDPAGCDELLNDLFDLDLVLDLVDVQVLV